jgi:hypothetical protein
MPPGGSGNPPARHYDLAARSFAARIRRKCRRWKRGTQTQNRHGGAPKGARSSAEGRRGVSQAPRHAALLRANRMPPHPGACRRSAHPSSGGRNWQRPGRKRAAGTRTRESRIGKTTSRSYSLLACSQTGETNPTDKNAEISELGRLAIPRHTRLRRIWDRETADDGDEFLRVTWPAGRWSP